MSIHLDKINMPSSIHPEYKSTELLDKVADYMTICESDQDSYYHWNYLKALYNKLSKLNNLSPKYKEIILVLEPFILKHGIYDSGDMVDLDSANLWKGYR